MFTDDFPIENTDRVLISKTWSVKRDPGSDYQDFFLASNHEGIATHIIS